MDGVSCGGRVAGNVDVERIGGNSPYFGNSPGQQ